MPISWQLVISPCSKSVCNNDNRLLITAKKSSSTTTLLRLRIFWSDLQQTPFLHAFHIYADRCKLVRERERNRCFEAVEVIHNKGCSAWCTNIYLRLSWTGLRCEDSWAWRREERRAVLRLRWFTAGGNRHQVWVGGMLRIPDICHRHHRRCLCKKNCLV